MTDEEILDKLYPIPTLIPNGSNKLWQNQMVRSATQTFIDVLREHGLKIISDRRPRDD